MSILFLLYCTLCFLGLAFGFSPNWESKHTWNGHESVLLNQNEGTGMLLVLWTLLYLLSNLFFHLDGGAKLSDLTDALAGIASILPQHIASGVRCTNESWPVVCSSCKIRKDDIYCRFERFWQVSQEEISKYNWVSYLLPYQSFQTKKMNIIFKLVSPNFSLAMTSRCIALSSAVTDSTQPR